MATRWAVQNGNWSATSTWDGGTLPTSADDVFADGRTVTIDQDITVLSIRTTQRSGGTNGGSFTTSGTRTITATGLGIVAGNSTCLTLTGNTSALTVVGAIVGGLASSTHGINATGTGPTINVTGNVSATSGASSCGISVDGATAVITVTGNVTAGTIANCNGIQFTGASASLTITGNVTGGSAATTYGVFSTGASATVTVTGGVTGGGGLNAYGIYCSGATSLATVTGTVTATNSTGNGIRSDATSSGYGVLVNGSMLDSAGGVTAIHSRFFRLAANANASSRYANTTNFPNGGFLSRVSPDNVTGMPAASNVRSGQVYGYNSELTGTLAVPPANAVAAGVPVDNTTGTAALRPSDIAGIFGAQIAAALSSP